MHRLCSRGIKIHTIYKPEVSLDNARLLKNLDLINSRRGSLGEVVMNNPTFGNVLNTSMISSLHRTIMSMELDSDIRAILLKTEKDFCLGTDHLYMAHSSISSPDKVERYLRELYSFIWDLSKVEKPLVPLVTGRVFGSGAALAGLCHFSISSQHATACFPETSFGFIPTGGSSYLLSRLPCEAGLYLALTGYKLHGSDIQAANLSHSTANITDFIENSLMYDLNNQAGPYPTRMIVGEAWRDLQNELDSYAFKEHMRDTLEVANRTNLTKFFRGQPENMKMTVADVLYNKKLREEALNSAPGTKYKGFSSQIIQNFLEKFELSYMQMLEKFPAKALSFNYLLPAIYRCFSASTLDDVMERLSYEAEHGEKIWAAQVLKTLSEKSPLALEMTFHLMKKAYESEWSECLQHEFKAALNLSKHPDFIDGAKKRLSRISGKPEWTSKFPVSKDQVLELSNNETSLEIDSKQGQLLPVKQYFREYPHNPRCWINEISPSSHHHRRDFDLEAQNFLNKRGFDIRDFNMKVPVVREKIYRAERIKQKIDEEEDRLERMSQDLKSVRMYAKTRTEAIERFVRDEKRFNEKMRKILDQKFKRAFAERVKKISERSVEAHNNQKRALLREMKDYVEEKVLYRNTENFNDVTEMLGINRLPTVPMKFPSSIEESYLPEVIEGKYEGAPKNDEFYTTNLADIEDASFYYMSGAERYTNKSALDEENMKNTLAEIFSNILLADSNEKNPKTENYALENDDPSELKNSLIHYLDSDRKITPFKIAQKKNNYAKINLSAKDELHKNKDSALYDEELTDLEDLHITLPAIKLRKEVPKKIFTKEIEENLAADNEVFTNLLEDVFVKTGCEDLKSGLEMLKNKTFKYDPEAMKNRRRKLASEKYTYDDKFYLDDEQSKMKKLFTNYFIQPGPSDIPNSLYKQLEVKNSKVLMSKIQGAIDDRDFSKRKAGIQGSDQKINFDEDKKIENENFQKLKSFGGRLKFEYDYLDIIYGHKSYVPLEYDNDETFMQATNEVYGICNFKESPEQWLEKALEQSIDMLFETRSAEEMHLSTAELLAYDQDLAEKLTPEGVRRLLMNFLHHELTAIQASRESGLEDLRDETSLYISSVKGIEPDSQNFLNKNPELRDTIEGYRIAKKMRRINNPKEYEYEEFNEVLLEPVIELMKHENRLGLLGTKNKSHKAIIDNWKQKDYMPRSQVKDILNMKKRSLHKLRDEMETSILVIKTVEEMLKKDKYKSMLKNPEDFEKILKENQDIY